MMYDDPDQPPKMRLDLKKASIVGDVGLDDVVTITITGKVCSISGPREYKERDYGSKTDKQVKKLSPGTLELEVSKISIAGNGYGAGYDED